MSNRAARTVLKIPAAANGKRMANGKARSSEGNGEVGLDGLVGHAGYTVRRFQIWIFQDFIQLWKSIRLMDLNDGGCGIFQGNSSVLGTFVILTVK